MALLNYFATFGIFVILASAHFGLAVNILANFAIFSACLEHPFLVYPQANAHLFSGTLICANFRRIKIETSRVDKRKKEE